MSQIEHYQIDTQAIEHEIERKGIVLGIDWTNTAQVNALAQEALNYTAQKPHIQPDPGDYQARAKYELFGLAALMLKTLEESAETGFLSHGGAAWKSFAHALWTMRTPSTKG